MVIISVGKVGKCRYRATTHYWPLVLTQWLLRRIDGRWIEVCFRLPPGLFFERKPIFLGLALLIKMGECTHRLKNCSTCWYVCCKRQSAARRQVVAPPYYCTSKSQRPLCADDFRHFCKKIQSIEPNYWKNECSFHQVFYLITKVKFAMGSTKPQEQLVCVCIRVKLRTTLPPISAPH